MREDGVVNKSRRDAIKVPESAPRMSRIQRHKTAIGRSELSRPMQVALAGGFITEGSRILDYGCGRGDDVRTLSGLGYDCVGWDPVHAPDGERRRSEVVNLGYVVNVIEEPRERVEALKAAWALTERLLVVSARVDFQALGDDVEEYADGVLTAKGTFQKFYSQTELRDWIDTTLDVLSVAAAPGIFLIFREEADRQRFSSTLFRRRLAVPVGRLSDELFDGHREALEPLMSFFEARGRVPESEEISGAEALVETFGSLPRAFRVIRNATGDEVWNGIQEQRRDDLRVYLALQRFRKRPRFSELPMEIRHDVRAFFGTYAEACRRADETLFAAGDRARVSEAMRAIRLGKLTPEALYLHASAVDQLPSVLRTLEGCARAFVGEIEGATLVKLDRQRPKISYLSYPEFDDVAHPSLAFSVVVWLDTMVAKHYDFSRRENPPILHRKEAFVPVDYPGRERFERLTRQEERRGLLDREDIGTRATWEALLEAEGFTVGGHVLRRA